MLKKKPEKPPEPAAMTARFLKDAEKRSAAKRAQDCRRLVFELGASPLKAYVVLAAAPVLAQGFDRCA